MKKFQPIAPVLGIRNLVAIMVTIMIAFTGCKKEDNDPVPVLSISGITVTPATSDIPKGYALEFTAKVNGNNLSEAEKAVTWTVTGGTSTGTVITANGTLGIFPDETAETLIITATSVADNSKRGTATVTVYELQPDMHSNNFEDAEIVEIEFMGSKRLCYYINGQFIIEGDIVIGYDSDEQVETNSQGNISTRGAAITPQTLYFKYNDVYYHTNVGKLWEEGKVFYIKDNIDDSWIRNAMNTISNVTNQNIKFIELKTKESQDYIRTYNKNRSIRITYDKESSQSPVGMQESITNPALTLKKSDDAMHEICHTLGLIHEHSRPDRDLYITVHNGRIKDSNSKEINFNMWGTTGAMFYKTDFDYESVMMYSSYAGAAILKDKTWWEENFGFGNDYLPTMTRNDNGAPVKEKDTYNLSTLDKKALNDLYPNRNAAPDVFIHPNNGNNVKPTSNSCLLTGEVIYEGYPAITEYGICYREIGHTSWTYIKATNKDDVGRYLCALADLKPNTTYEAGAYVKTQNGQPERSPQEPIKFTTLPGTSSNPLDGIWRLRTYKGTPTNGYEYPNWESEFQEFTERFLFTSINGNKVEFERQWSFGVVDHDGTLVPGGNETIKYSGIINSSYNYISGTYLQVQLWDKPAYELRTWSGNFEMWKIE